MVRRPPKVMRCMYSYPPRLKANSCVASDHARRPLPIRSSQLQLPGAGNSRAVCPQCRSAQFSSRLLVFSSSRLLTRLSSDPFVFSSNDAHPHHGADRCADRDITRPVLVVIESSRPDQCCGGIEQWRHDVRGVRMRRLKLPAEGGGGGERQSRMPRRHGRIASHKTASSPL